MAKKEKKLKIKQAEEFTPYELLRLNARRDSSEISKSQKHKKRAFWLLIALVAILLIMWLLSMFLTQWGDLVISVGRDAHSKGISISEFADMNDKTSKLSGDNVKEVTNITYDWLPFDELDNQDGSHNGKNHLAYTFYITNDGQVTVDVVGELQISGVSKSMDEAVRIMVYKNGKPEIYAKKPKGSGETEKFPDDIKTFITDSKVMQIVLEDMKPGQVDKFTIVSWVEGEDPECIDDIRGGYMRMSMLFGIADTEE